MQDFSYFDIVISLVWAHQTTSAYVGETLTYSSGLIPLSITKGSVAI
jgi:hypothetical protein